MPRPKSLVVYGKAFIRAREVIANTKDKDKLRTEYGLGTQEWLSDKANVSVKTIRALEVENKATLRTIDLISHHLKIKGREFIIGYGEHLTTCRGTGVVDFRPLVDGKSNSNYVKSPFVITIDPLLIEYVDDFTDSATLDSIHVQLTVDDLIINFQWLYLVELTESSVSWLGYQGPVLPTKIFNGLRYDKSIMFNQDEDSPVSWELFIDSIKASKSAFVVLNVTLKFEFFEKNIELAVSVDKIKILFERAQLKYGLDQPYPYWMQPRLVKFTPQNTIL